MFPLFPRKLNKERVIEDIVLHCCRCGWRGSRKARSLQRTFTYYLCSAHDRLHGISQRDPGPRQRPGDLNEPGKDGRADAVELAALGAAAALRELDLARVERAPELGHERAVEGVGGGTRGGGRAVEHAREPVGVVEDAARAERVVGAVGAEERRERGDVLFEDHSCRFGRYVLHGGGEGLAAPDCGHGRISCECNNSQTQGRKKKKDFRLWGKEYGGGTLTREEMFVDACELDVRLCRARHDQAVDDALRDGFGHRVPEQTLHHHRPRLREQRRVPRARHVRERRVLQCRRGRRHEAQHLARPAVDRALELRCRVLRAYDTVV